MSLFTTYIALGIAIALEVVGTSALQASQQFTRTVPTIVMAVSYLSAFYFLSLALRTLRDLVNPKIEKIRVDSRETFGKITQFVDELMPEIADRLEHYPGERPIFDLYGV